MTGYEIGATIIQIITLAGLIYSLNLTRQEYKIRSRPYLGVVDIVRVEGHKPRELEFDVIVKNTGSMPAKNAKMHGEFEVMGEGKAIFECETKGSIFPTSKDLPSWIVGINDIDKEEILKGTKELKLTMTIEYFGVSKDLYKTKSSRVYDAVRNRWIKEEGDWI